MPDTKKDFGNRDVFVAGRKPPSSPERLPRVWLDFNRMGCRRPLLHRNLCVSEHEASIWESKISAATVGSPWSRGQQDVATHVIA